MTIAEALAKGVDLLTGSGVNDPIRDADLLLRFVLDKDRTFLIAYPEYQLSSDEEARFQEALVRRCTHEPIQYILNSQDFFGLDFYVDRRVLIPRPETEILVEHALEFLDSRSGPEFLELGIGSGCISVAILNNLPDLRGTGVDISPEALEVAARNAAGHGVAERLDLIRSNLFEGVGERQFDLIVSNPPYISVKDHQTLDREVRDFEPEAALTDGADGQTFYGLIIDEAPKYLRPLGALMLEIGWDQADAVSAMFTSDMWHEPELISDLQGHQRVVKARRR